MYNNRYSELYHYGIKGQKHGQRRFQNEDGSLTPEGYRRYGIDPNWKPESGMPEPTAGPRQKAAAEPAAAPRQKAAADTPAPRSGGSTNDISKNNTLNGIGGGSDKDFVIDQRNDGHVWENEDARQSRFEKADQVTNASIPENVRNKMNYMTEHYGKYNLTEDDKAKVREAKETNDALSLYDKWQKVGDAGLTPAEKQQLESMKADAKPSDPTEYNPELFKQCEDVGIEVNHDEPWTSLIDLVNANSEAMSELINDPDMYDKITEDGSSVDENGNEMLVTQFTDDVQKAYDELQQYYLNCPYTTLTYELNQRGIPMEAGSALSELGTGGGLSEDEILPMYNWSEDEMTKYREESTNDSDYYVSEDKNYIRLSNNGDYLSDETIKEFMEPGARYAVLWEEHICNATILDDGTVAINDVQGGMENISLDSYSQYFGHTGGEMFRIDDRDIDMNYVKDHFTGKGTDNTNIKRRKSNGGKQQ